MNIINNTVKLLSIGTVILILLATIPISTAKKTLNDIHIPAAMKEKAEKIFNNNIQPLSNGGLQALLLLIFLIFLLGLLILGSQVSPPG